MRLADVGQRYVNDNKPWELAKQKARRTPARGVHHRTEPVPALTGLLKPVLPSLAAQVEAFLAIAAAQMERSGRTCQPVTPSTPTAT
jgi:methionyl-tRNA synthetase